MNNLFSLKTRRIVYVVSVIASILLAVFGIITDDQLEALLGMVALITGVSTLALANPTKEEVKENARPKKPLE